MKNLQFFPFERNQYYNGKLMTYQDMSSEQQYLNDKRRLINRFLHGVGVVSGLQVVRLDEKTLSVEAGFALDDCGREIVLEKPRVMMLDQIEGCGELGEAGEVSAAYLCLAYSEEGIYPSRNPDGSGRQTFERCREGGRLYLSTLPPEDDKDTLSSLSWQNLALFENRNLLVSCRIPAFAGSGETFPAILRIEARCPLPEVSVSLTLSLSGISCGGGDRAEWNWSGALDKAGDAVELEKTLTAYSIEDGTGSISMKRRQMTVAVAGQEFHPAADQAGRVLIGTMDVYHQMSEAWYAGAMNQVLGAGNSKGIYLAKIFLQPAGDELRIGEIEQLPFGQRVYNSFVNRGLIGQLIEELSRQKPGERRAAAAADPVRKSSGNLPGTASGVCEIPLGINGRSGERFFSGEIVHGLGLGPVSVELNLETEQAQYFGSAEIFEDMKIRAELAAKANNERGSFVIGARLLSPTSQEMMRVRWTVRLLPEDKELAGAPHIRILPDKPELRCMQTRYFRAETENLHGGTVLWEVCTPGGGTITRDGRYSAPNTEGIFEVRAFCQEDPKISCSVFVIVRE